jgi:transcription initiation factor TFIID subunit TAF12
MLLQGRIRQIAWRMLNDQSCSRSASILSQALFPAHQQTQQQQQQQQQPGQPQMGNLHGQQGHSTAAREAAKVDNRRAGQQKQKARVLKYPLRDVALSALSGTFQPL